MSDPKAARGVFVSARGLEAALMLPNAESASLCIYDGDRETVRTPMARDSDGVLRGVAPGMGAGAHYGFRVQGPYDPKRGLRFDPSKLLADPYAWRFDRPFSLHPSMFKFGEDSSRYAPKAIAGTPPEGEPGHKRIPPEALVIYELNLRGFSRLNTAMPEAARGTFAGLAHPASIEHLSKLGVTAVEIMPADAFVDERHLPPLGLSNAWGYNAIVCGAPDPRLAPGGWKEVRAATDALHAAGIEAILDVVFNHNGESDQAGPTLSFRGLDNQAWFRLDPNNPELYINDAGTGNCLALDRPLVIEMAIGALKHWVVQGGFDGFRFDLGTALGRRDTGFDPNAPFFQALAADRILAQARLIAEPWDIGPGGYRLGQFGPAFAEWNDRFRDATRRFWRGDVGLRGEIATRMAGSRDVFAQAAAPSKGVNFVVAHDGFTLRDLVSYERKHNEANGENNRDGTDNNNSWNHGVEGPSDDPAIVESRSRDERNLLTLLLASRGTPMLSMGSELGFSQGGNNNAYAQDNATSAIDWRAADPSLIAFTTRLIAVRRANAALSRDAFLTGLPFDASQLADVEWRDADGPMTQGAWNDPKGDVFVAVFSAPQSDGVDRVAVAMNRSNTDAEVHLPSPRPGVAWRAVIDTYDPAAPERWLALADLVRLRARSSLIVTEARKTGGPGRNSGAPGAETIGKLASAAGIAAEWSDISGKRTIVSPETKIALLSALGLEIGSESQARDSLTRLTDETRLRRLPFSLVLRADQPLVASLRETPRKTDARIERKDGAVAEWSIEAADGARRDLADGRAVTERTIALPSLPLGRHRLIVDGVECALTVAPPHAYSPTSASRKRFGAAAQLYALRRADDSGRDQGVGDFSALAVAGEKAGQAGAAYLGVSPLHMLFPRDRGRASPYYPSDRRFLDPIYIDVLDDSGLPRDEAVNAALASLEPRFTAASTTRSVEYEEVWIAKHAALQARSAAFLRLRTARPGDALIADYHAFARSGGETLRHFAAFQAVAAEGQAGGNWRLWPQDLRDGDPKAIDHAIERNRHGFEFALFCQWLADRQLGWAAGHARSGGLEIGLYRDLAVGAAPDGTEAWAHAGALARGVTVGAPPDPFSVQGQNWGLPAPNPLAGAREGWASVSAVYRANMRHAGMLRIDHAMGLQRLFLIPDGARPADGAYLSYPLDDLLGHIALESERAQCMVVGEDLGTVPEGFRDRLTRAKITGMRVLWFERKGVEFVPPASYPPTSVACVATHDLATLAGWWQGADIAERLSLGLLTLARAGDQIVGRREEKRALLRALAKAGFHVSQMEDGPLPDDTAAAVHALIGGSGSIFAHAQFDDLVGETVATNLPGTDRERPNWRLKVGPDVAAAFAGHRAQTILAALAKGRS
jgi:glycogen debranching enzyme GlgX/4-alpha-glucanotransferase